VAGRSPAFRRAAPISTTAAKTFGRAITHHSSGAGFGCSLDVGRVANPGRNRNRDWDRLGVGSVRAHVDFSSLAGVQPRIKILAPEGRGIPSQSNIEGDTRGAVAFSRHHKIRILN
jgi:hypothetical protein